MAKDSIVEISDIPVMFVAGDPNKPIPEQAPAAFALLESTLPSLKGRKFYGVSWRNEYRACVALDPGQEHAGLPHPTWTIPGGKYVRRRIADWENNLHLILSAFADLRARRDLDATRPCIEQYRSQRELLVMVPIV